MKKIILLYLAGVMSLLNQPVFSQEDTAALGMAGDNLDLYAVLTVFQKSKTIEEFEKTLNDEKTKINNLDLNLDKKIDFIKVVSKKKDNSHTFVLQVDVTKDETQDVAVILLDKDKNNKVSLQIVGDEELYGKDYVIEPKGNSSVTPNPAYTGENPVTVTVPAPTTTVVVESAPIVQYVYSPAYVPYVPPYHYGYYPPWFGFATVMAVGIYRHNHYHYHGGYYGGHYGGGNVVINNNNFNNFNNYNNNKMRSNTVSNNRNNGNYGNGNRDGNRGNNRGDNRGNNRGDNRGDNRGGDRGGNRGGDRPSASTRPSDGASNRAGVSDRQSGGFSDRGSGRSSSNFSSAGSGRTRSGGGGGGMRGGGGGGGRRR